MAKKLNGTLKTMGIITTIVLAAGGIIWGFAIHSAGVDGVIEDFDEQKIECKEVEVRVNTVEKAVIKIETNMEHMITMQGIIFKEITGRDPL